MKNFDIYFFLLPAGMFVIWGFSGYRFQDLRKRHPLRQIVAFVLALNEKRFEGRFAGEDRVNLELIKIRVALALSLALITLLTMSSLLILSDRLDVLASIDTMLSQIKCE